jgi:hypothetical protein
VVVLATVFVACAVAAGVDVAVIMGVGVGVAAPVLLGVINQLFAVPTKEKRITSITPPIRIFFPVIGSTSPRTLFSISSSR